VDIMSRHGEEVSRESDPRPFEVHGCLSRGGNAGVQPPMKGVEYLPPTQPPKGSTPYARLLTQIALQAIHASAFEHEFTRCVTISIDHLDSAAQQAASGQPAASIGVESYFRRVTDRKNSRNVIWFVAWGHPLIDFGLCRNDSVAERVGR
jgi:hypothetical protein